MESNDRDFQDIQDKRYANCDQRGVFCISTRLEFKENDLERIENECTREDGDKD